MGVCVIESLDLDRPMPPDVEAAFTLYRADGERSVRRTADLLNLPHGTVLGWSSRHRWQQRLAASDAEHRSDVLAAAHAAVAGQTLKSLNVMIAIRDDKTAPHAVRLSAARDIAGMGGLARSSAPPSTCTPTPPPPATPTRSSPTWPGPRRASPACSPCRRTHPVRPTPSAGTLSVSAFRRGAVPMPTAPPRPPIPTRRGGGRTLWAGKRVVVGARTDYPRAGSSGSAARGDGDCVIA